MWDLLAKLTMATGELRWKDAKWSSVHWTARGFIRRSKVWSSPQSTLLVHAEKPKGLPWRLKSLCWKPEGTEDTYTKAMVMTGATPKKKQGALPSSFPCDSIQAPNLWIGAPPSPLGESFCLSVAYVSITHRHTQSFTNRPGGSRKSIWHTTINDHRR